jgi:GT2 family glycosyltransferase
VTGPHRVAVIPTRDRPDMLYDCVNSVIDQVDHVFIIDNASHPPADHEQWPDTVDGRPRVMSARVDEDPPNLSRLWNLGLALADNAAWGRAATAWDIVVLNDDVMVPPGWVAALSTAMRETTAVLAYPDQFGAGRRILHTEPGPVDLRTRITGYAFMLRGEAGLRLDETFAWWYGDDDLDWRARQHGGALLVPGIPVRHRAPDAQTNARPELLAQAARDRQAFAAKWGRTPH